MKIVVFGGTGNVGQRIVREAMSRGHEVEVVVRKPDRKPEWDDNITVEQGDVTDPDQVAALTRGADAVVNAISPRPDGDLPASSLTDAADSLVQGLKQANVKRAIIVGGAGTLEVEPGVDLVDTPDFPKPYRNESIQQRKALNTYRSKADGLDWTYIAPAATFTPGERTGAYRTSSNELLKDDTGRSRISYEDFAVAVLDEIETPRHVRDRFGVAY